VKKAWQNFGFVSDNLFQKSLLKKWVGISLDTYHSLYKEKAQQLNPKLDCVFKEKVSFPFKLLAYIGIEKLCYEMK